MSADFRTVGQLIEQLKQFPEDMLVGSLNYEEDWETEGHVDGCYAVKVVGSETRSGWHIDSEHIEALRREYCQEIVVISMYSNKNDLLEQVCDEDPS